MLSIPRSTAKRLLQSGLIKEKQQSILSVYPAGSGRRWTQNFAPVTYACVLFTVASLPLGSHDIAGLDLVSGGEGLESPLLSLALSTGH